MARLPVVGSDSGTWGTILNDYLSQQHDADGAHQFITIPDTTDAATGIVFAADTNLYRSAANTLKTDDSLVVTGTAIASNYKRGAGSPEGAVTGAVGDLYLRTDGTTGTTLYVKESGAGNTGWVAVAASSIDTIDELTDVTITTVADEDFLVYDSGTSQWRNRTIVDSDIPAAIARDAEVSTAVSDHSSATTAVHGISNTANLAYVNADNNFSTAQTFQSTVTASNYKRGAGSPEGVVTGAIGDVYQRTDGSTGTTFYIKESGAGNTGWVAVAGAGSGLSDHLADTADAHDASAISILDTAADFTATDVEGALAELQTADEADEAALAAHISDATAAHAASAVSVSSTTLVGTGTDVQAVFEELDNAIVADETALANHLADTADAHDASAISILDTAADFTATDVEGALAELQTADEADEAALAAHLVDTTAVHGISNTANLAYVNADNNFSTAQTFQSTVTASNYKRGAGSPEGAVTGAVGDLYLRTDGTTGTTLYVKESGAGNTGWVALSAGASSAVYAETFGDATNTSYTITHNLGSDDVFVGVYQISDGAEVGVDIERATTNTVTIGFAEPPGINTMRVIVAGAFDDGEAGGGGQPSFPITQDSASATTDDILRSKLTADTQYRHVVSTDGLLEWGPGGATAPDTNLYRSAADTLKTDDSLVVIGTAVASNYKRGTGTPEGSVTGSVGDLYLRTDGTTGTTLYVKESGAGNTGWVAVAASSIDTIDELTDVTITTVADEDFLVYDSGTSQWRNRTIVDADIPSGIARDSEVSTAVSDHSADTTSVHGIADTSTLLTSLNVAVASKTANYTATTADSVILCSASGGAFTITLPASSGNTGKVFNIKKTDSSANAVTVDGNASETIDGATTAVISTQFASITIVCDGSNWHII